MKIKPISHYSRNFVAASFSLRRVARTQAKACGYLLILAATLLFTSGCTTTKIVDPVTGQTNTVSKIDPVKVYALAKGAAAIGTTEALRVKPEWRQNFVDAKTQLDKQIADGTLSGQRLREILDQLPIKELKSDTARIAILGATLLFDVATGSTVNIEQNEYVLAASKGVSEGIGSALQ